MYITRSECEEQQSDAGLGELFFALKSKKLFGTKDALPVPQLVKQLKMETVAGNYALIFEKLSDTSLEDKCKTQPFDVPVLKRLAKSLLESTKALMRCRTAHLDNHIGNIFYNDEEQKATFIDFGESVTKNGQDYEVRMSQDIMNLVIDCYVQRDPTEANKIAKLENLKQTVRSDQQEANLIESLLSFLRMEQHFKETFDLEEVEKKINEM
ncbi:unnamed protein product [Didymodactylos carnosus]|uniref:ABC1 atypical kinase-like domain-containing protein n=1 Tax=Didymodactylos carnosus TaxID=1234261 RepID=A0A815I8E5_9BILA|nr:unnamed protein product [Didymodactylos carnosus]CAF1362586.1 unnamed protein product [Didymodactylos carnosus]CAF4001592.1 unnamed protein product [Didymodactylos carnosus]CAF4242321.1 unnamed protein product [Didymodactylos carnosus]